ncbi:MAG: hypothetical protein WBA56_04385, partial [Stenotrophomonas sp.]
ASQVPGLPGTGLHREGFMRGKPRIYPVGARQPRRQTADAFRRAGRDHVKRAGHGVTVSAVSIDEWGGGCNWA